MKGEDQTMSQLVIVPKQEVEYYWKFYVINNYVLNFIRVVLRDNKTEFRITFDKYHQVHISIDRAYFPWPYYSALIFATKWTRNQFMMENAPVQQKVKCQLENYTENPQPYNLPIYNIKGIKIWYHRMSLEMCFTHNDLTWSIYST